MCSILWKVAGSTSAGTLRSLAITTPFVARIPTVVVPARFTAAKLCSIWSSFPDGEKVVSE